jgi:hypothetical protein
LTLTAFAIAASSPVAAVKHKSSGSSDAESEAEAEVAITKKLLESTEAKPETTEGKPETTTTKRRRTTRTGSTVPTPTPPTTDSTATLSTIQQYFAQHDDPAWASVTLPEGTQLNVGAQVPSGVAFVPLPYDLMPQMPSNAHYAYFVSGNNVVVIDADSNTIAGVFPTHR